MVKIIIAAALFLAASAFTAVKLIARRNEKQKLQKAAKDREREQELEQRLKNRRYPEHLSEREPVLQTPYEVAYQENEKKKEKNIFQLELTVVSGVARKRYVLPVKEEIFIGKGENNDLILHEKGVSRSHCCLLRNDSGIYAKDLNSTNGTVVIRKDQKTALHGQSVRLHDGDLLLLGGCTLEVKIFA